MTSTAARVWHTPDAEAARFLPEGPRLIEFEGEQAVAWVNIQAGPDEAFGDVFVRGWRSGRTSARRPPGRPGFALPTDRPGVLLVGCDHALGLFDLTDGKWEPLAVIEDAHPRAIINDAEVVPGGRAVVFGTKDTKFAEPLANLYLFTPADNRVTLLAGGQTCSNGKVFADGGRTLFDIDTPRKVVTEYRLDVANRTLTEVGVAVDLRSRDDFPDGMCDGGDGTVIVAFYNPALAEYGTAVRFRLGTGEALEEWRTPGSPRVTCPLLVPTADGVKLLLTTADEGVTPEMRQACPNAGCLFVADTGMNEAPVAEVVLL